MPSATEMIGDEGRGTAMYLHTSPEFSMKKLLAAGEERIASLGHVWRNRERSALHHPEFTMARVVSGRRSLRRGDRGLRAACCALPREIVGTAMLRYPGQDLRPLRRSRSGIRVGGCLPAICRDRPARDDGRRWRDGCRGAGGADASGVQASTVPQEYRLGRICSAVMLVEKVEPHLGMGRVTILDRYPASGSGAGAAASGRSAGAGAVRDLWLRGRACQRLRRIDRCRRAAAPVRAWRWTEKQRLYGERYPLDEDFLAALALMPEASGVALGFDRLVMLAVGAPRIEDVIWVPVAEKRHRERYPFELRMLDRRRAGDFEQQLEGHRGRWR